MPMLPLAWQSPLTSSVDALIAQYERGYAGARHSEEAHERFLDSIPIKSGEDVCRLYGYEESAKGKLILPHLFAWKKYPKVFPGVAQLEGDCVGQAARNAAFYAAVGDVVAALPDEDSGLPEELPDVSEVAERNGVFACEANYAFRSTKPGHGWFCHEAAQVLLKHAALALRQKYDEIDLERYTKETVNYWNRRSVSDALRKEWAKHTIREATELKTFEALRDLLARGCGVLTCGDEAFSRTRDENGVCSRTRETWYHALIAAGVDDRPWAHQTYGGPLVLVGNSWAEYMTGPRKIYGTDYEIPPGYFWARWSDWKKRTQIAMAGARGWAKKALPMELFLPGWD